MRSLCPILFDKYLDVFARLSSDAEPIVDAFTLEDGAGIGFFAHRVIMPKFFQDSTVAGATLIDGAKTIERAIFSAQTLHSNTNRHCANSP